MLTAFTAAQASPAHTPGYFEAIAAGSVSQVNAGNGHLAVTSSETDKLVQTNNNSLNSWGGQLGLGYVYFISKAKRYSNHVQWFPVIEPELNVYYNDYQNKGDVYRFGSAAFNELTYNMPIHSTRVMLDAALTVASYKRFSTYLIAGIGDSWNRVGYSDKDNSGDMCDTQNVHLNTHTSSNFVWEAGVGVAYAFNNHAKLSFQYLYTDFGTLKTSGSGTSGTITNPTLSPASFNLHTQALLLGLHLSV